MLHALLIDDEIHSTEGIKYTLDWESLGVTTVHTANNILHAQKILEEQDVQLVITDIEMPRGSGYDLLRWMRENGYNPIVIILTSYGTFEYAKQAIDYQCLDFLLKPVSRKALQGAVQKGIGVYFERQNTDVNSRLAEYWNSNRERRLRNFWRDVMEDASALKTTADILSLADQLHIPYTAQSIFLPALYKLHPADGQEMFRTWAPAFHQRLYFQVFQEGNVVLVSQGACMWAVVEVAVERENDYIDKVLQASKAFTEWGMEEHNLSISCYFGQPGDAGLTAEQFGLLLTASRNNVAGHPGVFPLSQATTEIVYERPDIDAWIGAFSRGDYGSAIQQADVYVDSLAKNRSIDQMSLHQLLQDFMQAFYIAVGEKNIQAHLLFGDHHSLTLYENADQSIESFKAWIHHLVHKASEYAAMVSDANSMVGNIKQYIKKNLSEDLSRNQIAENVFLSPDYVSRVFRRETGIQLSEYISQVRMREARRLLENTDLLVGDIAYRTGYDNLAYFSRVFRIRNGVTPAQYRAEFLAKSSKSQTEVVSRSDVDEV